MAPGGQNDPVHPVPTRRSGYHYFFYSKHHGGGTRDDSRWLPGLSHEEEFSIFDAADRLEVSDDRGWLYGLLRTEEGQVRYIGTRKQQLAVFPFARAGVPWHGYPLWPLDKPAATYRQGDKFCPPNEVLRKMVQAGLFSASERRRIRGGHDI